VLLVAVLVSQAAASAAPSPTPRPSPVVRVSVGIVQVDAIVTDGKGHHVTDLGPADFVLKEEGQIREISHVSYVVVAPVIRAVVAGSSPEPGPSAVSSVPARLITLVVDDLNLSFESTIRLKDTLRRFVLETLSPSDRVALVRTGGGMGTMQQFTSDRRALRAAIDRVRFNPLGTGRITATESIDTEMPFGGGPQGGSPSGRPSRKEVQHQDDIKRSEFIAVGTLGMLRSVVRSLAPLAGRKAVVFFSDGLSLVRNDDDRRVENGMNGVIAEANRSSVTLYTIDTRGLFNTGLQAQDNVASVSQGEAGRLLVRRDSEDLLTRMGLGNLADRTGGFMISHSNDLGKAIQTAVADQQGYYLIGYMPPPSDLESGSGPRRFHKLEVAVRRPGLRVRSRSGYYGVPDAEAPPPSTRAERLTTALLSPFAAADIPLRLQTVFLDDEKLGPCLRALLHVDGKEVTFTDGEGGRQASVDVIAVTFGEGGQLVDQKNQTFTIRAGAAADTGAARPDLFYSVDLPVKRPGPYQFRVVVRDVASDRLGAAGQFVDIPDLGKGRLSLSGIVARDVADEQAAGLRTETLVGRLRPGRTVEYVFQILNARRDPATRKTRLSVQARFWRDRELLYDGPAAPLAAEEAAGRASLSPGLFYKFRASADIEFVCVDTSKEHFFRSGRIYEYPKHWEFMQAAFPPAAESPVKWRIPFGHHPPYSAGPQHHNTRGMAKVVDLFQRSGVRVSFSGHEHNFQHSIVDGIDYFVSGAGAKIRRRVPNRFEEAHTQTWSGECHFLLCTIDGDRMTVRAIGDSPGDTLLDIPRATPSGDLVRGPIVVGRSIVA